MERRKFFTKVTAATAVSASLNAEAKKPRTVEYNVKGFTCITCAVGLETMLRGRKGITSAQATYPANQVKIAFDEHMIAEAKIKEFIKVCGFAVA